MIRRVIIRNGKKYIVNCPSYGDNVWLDGVYQEPTGSSPVPPDPYDNVLVFSGSYLSIPNPSGNITQSTSGWIEVHGHNCQGLTGLDVSNNQLNTFDLENCNTLSYLNCNYNFISALDVNTLPTISHLDCGNNTYISVLNLNVLPLLEYLDCSNTSISTLDINNNTLLQILYCGFTSISTLDVGTLPILSVLECGYIDTLLSLYTSGSLSLSRLVCGPNGNLSTLDISNNTLLSYFDCDNTNISTLDISNNSKLQHLNCSNCANISTLDISNNTLLSYFDCSGNNIVSQTVIDNILSKLVLFKLSNGFCDLSGGTNVSPSVDGTANALILTSKGWKVYTN